MCDPFLLLNETVTLKRSFYWALHEGLNHYSRIEPHAHDHLTQSIRQPLSIAHRMAMQSYFEGHYQSNRHAIFSTFVQKMAYIIAGLLLDPRPCCVVQKKQAIKWPSNKSILRCAGVALNKYLAG